MPRPTISRSRRPRAPSIVLALFGLLGLAAPAIAAPPQVQTWHRLNPASGDVAPEHERFQCLPGVTWVCRYDKLPGTGLHWDRTIAMFQGTDTTDGWECPGFFDEAVCDATVRVIGGVAHFRVAAGGAFRTGHELIFTDAAGIAPFWIHWTDSGFACPWYGSFADAQAANPTGTEIDCMGL
jgi:hypothetical protein